MKTIKHSHHNRALLSSCASVFERQPFCSVVEWAERERVVTGSAIKGKYRSEVTPFARAWQESFTDPAVQTTVLMVAKRLSKTESLCNLIGHQIDTNPRNILVGYPTLDSAKKFSRQFFTPMIRASKALAWRIKDTRNRSAANTLHAKEFPGGVISFVGAVSPTAFRQVQAPVVLMDEIDDMGATQEGDPIFLAFGRSENYSDCIQVLASTPTIKGHSKIEEWYLRSDQQKWHVCCQNADCLNHAHGWVLTWKDVVWNDPTGLDAVLRCPVCSRDHTDEERQAMVLAGKWIATAPFRGIRGYWMNGLNSPFPAKTGFKGKLHQFVGDFITAKAGGASALQAWTNTFLCETWEVKGEQHTAQEFANRLEDYDTRVLPEGVHVLVAGADVQKDRIEAEIIGFGHGCESWGIERVKILGDTMLKDVWDKLYAWLDREFEHQTGARIRIKRAHIDSGGSTPGITKTVYGFCGRSGRPWYAVKGGNVRMQEPIREAKRASRVIIIDTIYFKNQIFDWLAVQEPGPRFSHFPKSYDDEFFAQLCAEKRDVTFDRGVPRYKWELVRSNKRNEAFDIRVYAYSAIYALNPDWDSWQKWYSKQKLENVGRKIHVEHYDQKPVVKAVAPVRQRIGGIKSLGGLSSFLRR